MCQRLTEDLEYAYLLDRAAEKTDFCEQACYVAAYAVTCYSTTGNRTTKPFNPLLGETYEFDRSEDLGWRSLTEQVWLLIVMELNYFLLRIFDEGHDCMWKSWAE